MAKVGGFKQAIDMLSGLDAESSKRILDEISQTDPAMAEAIKNHLVTIEEIQYITPKMLVELFRDIDLKDMGMALRIGSPELRKFILSNISSGMGSEINDILDGPAQPKSKVNESLERVMDVFRKKVEKKEIIIDKNAELV